MRTMSNMEIRALVDERLTSVGYRATRNGYRCIQDSKENYRVYHLSVSRHGGLASSILVIHSPELGRIRARLMPSSRVNHEIWRLQVCERYPEDGFPKLIISDEYTWEEFLNYAVPFVNDLQFPNGFQVAALEQMREKAEQQWLWPPSQNYPLLMMSLCPDVLREELDCVPWRESLDRWSWPAVEKAQYIKAVEEFASSDLEVHGLPEFKRFLEAGGL